MGLAFNLGVRSERWEMDLSSPPVERVQKGSKVLGVFVIVFAVFWGGAPVLGLLSQLQTGSFGSESVLFLVFPALGFGLLLFEAHTQFWRRRIVFDGTAFMVAEYGLEGTKRWH